MTFKIIEYLEIVSEITTEWTTKCPVCDGKLKVKKDNGAYKCFTQGCSTNKIRKTLGLKCRDVPFTQTKFIKPIPLEDKNFSLVPNYEPHYKVQNNEIFYSYNPYFVVKRVNQSTGKKVFYPYFKINNQWKKSRECYSEDKFLLSSFYYEHLIEEGDIVFITEGEKCTDFILENFGVKCITPAGFCWNESWLKYHLAKLNLGGICIIPDHDKVGFEKAYLTQRIAWTLEIPCTVEPLQGILEEGKDIADLNKKEIQKVRKKIFSDV